MLVDQPIGGSVWHIDVVFLPKRKHWSIHLLFFTGFEFISAKGKTLQKKNQQLQNTLFKKGKPTAFTVSCILFPLFHHQPFIVPLWCHSQCGENEDQNWSLVCRRDWIKKCLSFIVSGVALWWCRHHSEGGGQKPGTSQSERWRMEDSRGPLQTSGHSAVTTHMRKEGSEQTSEPDQMHL